MVVELIVDRSIIRGTYILENTTERKADYLATLGEILDTEIFIQMDIHIAIRSKMNSLDLKTTQSNIVNGF